MEILPTVTIHECFTDIIDSFLTTSVYLQGQLWSKAAPWLQVPYLNYLQMYFLNLPLSLDFTYIFRPQLLLVFIQTGGSDIEGLTINSHLQSSGLNDRITGKVFCSDSFSSGAWQTTFAFFVSFPSCAHDITEILGHAHVFAEGNCSMTR